MHIPYFDHICLPYYGKVYFELDLLYWLSKQSLIMYIKHCPKNIGMGQNKGMKDNSACVWILHP